MKQDLVRQILGKIKVFGQYTVPIETGVRDPDLIFNGIVSIIKPILVNHFERSSIPIQSQGSNRRGCDSG